MKVKEKLISLLESLLKKLKGEENNPDPEPKKRTYNGKDLWNE